MVFAPWSVNKAFKKNQAQAMPLLLFTMQFFTSACACLPWLAFFLYLYGLLC